MIDYLKSLYRSFRHENVVKAEAAKKNGLYTTSDELAQKVLDDVQANGVSIVENFVTPDQCDELRLEVDRIISEYKSQLWIDDGESDFRAFGADIVSQKIKAFMEHSVIQEISKGFEQSESIESFILGAHLTYKPNNLGSGGGWHRDRPDRPELKILLYLTDVGIDNGPFQYYVKSHSSSSVFGTVVTKKFEYMQSRFTDEEIDQLGDKNLLTACAKKGTLLVADTRGIHRGMPITEGERYALTKYTWGHKMPEHQRKLLLVPNK